MPRASANPPDGDRESSQIRPTMGPNPISLAVAVVLGGLALLAIAVGRAIAVPSSAVDR